ncbi:MAG: beta-N-acetylhexosaminidase, partial [Halanaerobiales bacterium]
MKILLVLSLLIPILFLNIITGGGDNIRAESEINQIIRQMSLEEKIGQLFMVGFPGSDVDENIKNMIEEYHVGGIIYFRRNIDSLNQVTDLCRELQKSSFTSSELPLLIATDQEGGIVSRLKGGTHFPGNMSLGATRSQDLAFKAGKATGRELKYTGINMNLAPVLDVNNNPDNPVIGVRSFGEDPELVADLGTAYMEGLQSEGVIATGKHFPGHGDTAVDSHLNLPVIEHDRERLNKVELYPFQEAINQNIDSIMTAHVHFPAIESEPEIPATLSEKVLNGLLREEMNFQGVIITDCMEMSAIADSSGTVEGAVKTLQAGSDLVLISHTYEKQVQAIQGVIKAVKESRISEKSIDNSLKRILELKEKRMGLDSERFDKNMKKNKLNPELNREIAQKIAEKGITLAKDEELIPVKNIENKDIAVINFESSVNSQVEDDTNYNNIFTERLSPGTNSVTPFSVNEEKP